MPSQSNANTSLSALQVALRRDATARMPVAREEPEEGTCLKLCRLRNLQTRHTQRERRQVWGGQGASPHSKAAAVSMSDYLHRRAETRSDDALLARAYQRGQRRVCRGAGGDFDDIVKAIRIADFEVAGGVETGEREQLSLFGCRV